MTISGKQKLPRFFWLFVWGRKMPYCILLWSKMEDEWKLPFSSLVSRLIPPFHLQKARWVAHTSALKKGSREFREEEQKTNGEWPYEDVPGKVAWYDTRRALQNMASQEAHSVTDRRAGKVLPQQLGVFIDIPPQFQHQTELPISHYSFHWFKNTKELFSKMMITPAEEENNVEVRREDQTNINKFARLNARLHELRDERKVIKVSLDNSMRHVVSTTILCWDRGQVHTSR